MTGINLDDIKDVDELIAALQSLTPIQRCMRVKASYRGTISEVTVEDGYVVLS